MIEYNQLAQWIQSQNGSEFCQYNHVPEEIKSKLRQEDKFTVTIDGLRYTVKDYDGKWLVFRRNIDATKLKSLSNHDNGTTSIVEIKLMSLSKANDCLQSKRSEYQMFGSDPLKIINNDPIVLMVKRSGDTQR